MSSLPNVAVIGATGSLGCVVLQKLLAAGFPVTVFTRQGSDSAAKLSSHPNQTVIEVDYKSKESLTAAFKGTNAAVSTLGFTGLGDQNLLVDAALASGTVTRFIPSEFGSDIHHPKSVHLPVFASKIAVIEYIDKVAAENPHFTYTSIQNNAFLDWGLAHGSLFNLQEHTATLWDGGDVPFSTTTLGTVADAVVAILQNLEKTANQTIKVHDAVVTQNQLIAMVKKIDGKEWKTTVKSTQSQEDESFAELKKPEPNYAKAMQGFLAPAVWGEGRSIYASQVQNKMLGLKEMSTAEVEEVVKTVVQSL